MTRRSRELLALFTVFISFSTAAAQTRDVGREFIALDHWSYAALARFEALRLVALPSERPYTRADVIGYVDTIESRVGDNVALSARDRWELGRLVDEFTRIDSRADPKLRWDPALMFMEETPFALEGDLDLSFMPRQAPFDDQVDFFVGGNPELRLHIGDWVTYDVRYRVLFGPERDGRARDEKPTPRTRSFKGLTTLYERAYVVFQWHKAVAFWGRDYIDWGPSMHGNLLVAETAQSFDKFGGRLDFKKVRMSFFQAKLDGASDRYLAGHRVEVQMWDFVFGLAETALYYGRGFDPLYMLPFSLFYANQFSERDDDNIIWSMDAKYRGPWGLLLWGSVVIDDAQFERDAGTPDKLGADVGVRYAMSWPIQMTIESQYRYVDIYTYTHRDSLTYHVTGSAMPLEGDWPIGVEQGPDADSFFARASFFPWPSVTGTLGFAQLRRGEGSDWRIHQMGDDPFPPFPSGVIEKTTAYTIGGLWELRRNSRASFDVSRIRVTNQGHQAGVDEWTTSFRMRLTWDL